MNKNSINIIFAQPEHADYAEQICQMIYESALQRGTGIAKRTPEYISMKITGGKAVVVGPSPLFLDNSQYEMYCMRELFS